MLAKFKEGDTEQFAAERRDSMFERVIFRCVIGSRAYRLAACPDTHVALDVVEQLMY